MNLQVSPLLSNIKLNNDKINNLDVSKESLIQNQIKEIKDNQELTFKLIESIKKKAEVKLKNEIETINTSKNNHNKNMKNTHKVVIERDDYVNELEESMNSIKLRSFKALDEN